MPAAVSSSPAGARRLVRLAAPGLEAVPCVVRILAENRLRHEGEAAPGLAEDLSATGEKSRSGRHAC